MSRMSQLIIPLVRSLSLQSFSAVSVLCRSLHHKTYETLTALQCMSYPFIQYHTNYISLY